MKKILVLEDGRISESGTHEELVSREGMYRRIYEIQNAVETAEREEGSIDA